MGCQCAKSEEKSNMDLGLDTSNPPPKIDITEPKVNDTVNQSREVSKVEDSKVKGKRKKKAANSNENFVMDLVNAINRVRANPAEFSKTVLDSVKNIRQEEGKIIFDANGTKVALSNGEETFKNVANYLKNLSSEAPLELKEDLVIQVPEDNKNWKDKALIAKLVAEKKEQTANTYSEIVFSMDLGVSDPELCLLLQIVDDSPFKGKRRENLLNPNYKYIGVSFNKQKSKFCCFLTFGK